MQTPKCLAVRFACLGLFLSSPAFGSGEITYNKTIRPILSDNCFRCHGPDKKARKGKFRLDIREDALAKSAIVPGKPQESELITRILSTRDDEMMPPPEAHKTLTPAQKDLLRRWIAGGAQYEKHWAYVPPVKPSTPPEKNPIDVLVGERLRELGLKPSPPADRRTLARRLYFDLVGLPPKPAEVEAFTQEKSPEAVSALIEKLMGSPQFGERMALGWLDVVRFADTIGYHSDNPRNVWPYRDYVIKTFNENKPFDQFTREQLAGDLLPNAATEQKVGSAFNRLLLSTEEGGAQPKDYEARMLTDRVRAVGAVWLGQTIGCAQCHDHKFDPITQRDFYSMGAFFADIDEPIIGGRGPGMLLPDEKQAVELDRLRGDVARAEQEFDTPHAEWLTAYTELQRVQAEALKQEGRWTALTPAAAGAAADNQLEVLKDSSVLARGKKADKVTYAMSFTNVPGNVVGLRLEALPHESLPEKGSGRAKDGGFVLTKVSAKIQRAGQTAEVLAFNLARADFQQEQKPDTNSAAGSASASLTDKLVKGEPIEWGITSEADQPHQLVLGLSSSITLQAEDTLILELYQNQHDHLLGHFRIGITTNADALTGPLRFPPPKEFADLLLIPEQQRNDEQKAKLFAYFKGVAPEAADARKQLAEARKAKDDFEGTIPRCLVSSTNSQPRTVRILPRGNFLIETGDMVEPALPGYLVGTSKTADTRRLNRLDLANWLVARENPLTARVIMNRLWKQFFGLGLSRVVDDLGAQGESPPNQPLLDWLAVEFMDNGWDLKRMVRLIVNSATYQQTSVASKGLRARDPLNRELAVQSRWRLDAELVRDNALALSGLLVEKIGGASVKPYQPDGYWENLNFPERTYEASAGSDQYRRGLYSWWQRSYLHPSLAAFDAPTREECAAERNRSNIPQQALVLLNDPTYVEASRSLAARILKEGGTDAKSRLTWLWREVLSRAPRRDEIETIQALLNKHLKEYRTDPVSAKALLHIGQAPLPQEIDPAELAAWTSVARVILNLHETITRS